MSKKKYHISYSNMPPRFPLVATAFWWMFLDYTNAPGWVFGAVGVLILVMWVSFFYDFFTKDPKDIFDDE